MAKDDYMRIVCLILTYLYARLRGRIEETPEVYLQPMTKDFPVDLNDPPKMVHHSTEITKFDPSDPIERARAIEIWENHRRRNARYAKIALEIWREKYG